MSDAPTPEVDQCLFLAGSLTNDRVEALEKLARRLQRERDEARESLRGEIVRADAYMDGMDEARRERDELLARVAELEGALIRLRDCDWTISLPDRMDAVREIAREALANKEANHE